MTPTTPRGTRTLRIRKPLGRLHSAMVSPTGSGRLATSRTPDTMAAMRSGVRSSRSRIAPVSPEESRSAWLASVIFAALVAMASAIATNRAFLSAVVSCAIRVAALCARSSLSRVEQGVRRLVAIGRLSFLRRKISSNLAFEGPRNGVGMAPVGNGDAGAGFAGQLGGAQLGAHAARAQLALAVAHGFHGRGQLADRTQQARAFAIGKVEAIDVSEQKQPVGLDRGGQQGAQFIVVAEGP